MITESFKRGLKKKKGDKVLEKSERVRSGQKGCGVRGFKRGSKRDVTKGLNRNKANMRLESAKKVRKGM